MPSSSPGSTSPRTTELSRFARLYGGTVQRLVGAGLQFFDRTVRQRVGGWNLPDEERDRIVYGKAAGYTELVSRLVPRLQGRHREHSVLAYLVTVTEGFMEERGLTPPVERDPPAIAFLDLTGYSTLAEERGDEAAPRSRPISQPSRGRSPSRTAVARSSGSETASCSTSPTRTGRS